MRGFSRYCPVGVELDIAFFHAHLLNPVENLALQYCGMIVDYNVRSVPIQVSGQQPVGSGIGDSAAVDDRRSGIFDVRQDRLYRSLGLFLFII